MRDTTDGVEARDPRARPTSASSSGPSSRCANAGTISSGLCPFHGEKTPSFHVHPDRGFFKCFGCGAGGDVISFFQLLENLTFPEARARAREARRRRSSRRRHPPRRASQRERSDLPGERPRRGILQPDARPFARGGRRARLLRGARHHERDDRIVPPRLCARTVGVRSSTSSTRRRRSRRSPRGRGSSRQGSAATTISIAAA